MIAAHECDFASIRMVDASLTAHICPDTEIRHDLYHQCDPGIKSADRYGRSEPGFQKPFLASEIIHSMNRITNLAEHVSLVGRQPSADTFHLEGIHFDKLVGGYQVDVQILNDLVMQVILLYRQWQMQSRHNRTSAL